MATIEEFIGHYKNARNAVRNNDLKQAKAELYNFLLIIAEAAQSASKSDKIIMEAIFNSYFQVYEELRCYGITDQVRESLCVPFVNVLHTGRAPIPSVRPMIIVDDGFSHVDYTKNEEGTKPSSDNHDSKSSATVDSEGADVPSQDSTYDDTLQTDNRKDSNEIKDDSVANKDDVTELGDTREVVVDAGSKAGLRPKTFADFIGQTRAVERLKRAIAVAQMDGKHCIADQGGILLKGPTGLGKTTLMRIVANELGVKYREFNTASLKNDVTSQRSFESFLENIAKENVPVVIGMDEIHAIPSGPETMLLTLLEDRIYKKMGAGEEIVLKMPEFTFIGATTDADKLTPAHRGRYKKGIELELVDYTLEEWQKIVVQKFTHYGLSITDIAVNEIVTRSRSSVRDVEGYVIEIYEKARIAHVSNIDAEMVRQHFNETGIEPNGLNATDVRILEALESSKDYTLSEENLCNKVNISIGEFQEERKPFLVRGGFLESYNRGQKLTPKALQFLKDRKENSPHSHKAGNDTDDQSVSVIPVKIDTDFQSNRDADSFKTKGQILTAETLLDLLTGKYATMAVEKTVLCDDFGCSIDEITPIIEKLCNEMLVRIKATGVIATIDAYERLGKPFPRD